jgi:hypothetical protein
MDSVVQEWMAKKDTRRLVRGAGEESTGTLPNQIYSDEKEEDEDWRVCLARINMCWQEIRVDCDMKLKEVYHHTVVSYI